MFELWIALKDIPAEGREFHFTDQSLWTGPMDEYGVQAKPGKDFEARMFVTPQDEGFLVVGSFSGSVILPCDRCLKELDLPVSGDFESFEEPRAKDDDSLEVCRIRRGKNVLDLDVAGYLWEQFMLALPVNLLCDEECKGLCPNCGVNRNQESCACAQTEGDPRLAVLRNLKLS
ncbi:MAG: metal-binding protein [Deltaproteobacteria bacterium HGW-Deltaproteobacteria-8]|jgi:uncharacterized protein|nr:MAG: metal-binding protein [Deltaproteobacteria bacterium HGW-Deltaproteobacteria-8]